MSCSQDHFIPILDELDQRAKEAEAIAAMRKRRGGPRPGSGPPKGNLNALKHGRFSRRHKIILETILSVPEARDALTAVLRHGIKRQKQEEIEAAYVLMRWLSTHNPQFLPAVLDGARANVEAQDATQRNDQTRNDQLEADLADMRGDFHRRLLRNTTKKSTPKTPKTTKDGRPS